MRDPRRLIPPPIRRKRPGRNARRADALSQAAVLTQRAEFWIAAARAYMAHVAAKGSADAFDLLALDAFSRQISRLDAQVHACHRPRLVVDNTPESHHDRDH